jgi:hypothetical protein
MNGYVIFFTLMAFFFVMPFLGLLVHRRMQLQDRKMAEKATQDAASKQDLEDRVVTLERIVTDRGYDVATQIEALRDQRRVEKLLEAPQSKGRI